MPIEVGAKTVINIRQFFWRAPVARLVLFFYTSCVEIYAYLLLRLKAVCTPVRSRFVSERAALV
jgi:hypothetical protein